MAARTPSGRLTAAARRAQLIDVGRRVFAERGYEATSVEEIAERAKVSKPIVYEHFGGKEGLYAVVVDGEVERILSSIVAAVGTGSARELSLIHIWSSTTYKSIPSLAWTVEFLTGFASAPLKTANAAVRAVRGGAN